MKKYRFDNNYGGKIYEYDKNARAYLFFSSYYAIGINAKMSEKKKIQTIEETILNDPIIEVSRLGENTNG